MGRQIVKQPDGKFAIWSSVVDDFVVVDCADVNEIIESIMDDARRDITTAATEVVAKLERGEKPYYQHTKSFDQCIEIIREVHGDDHVNEVMKEFGFDLTEGDES